MRLYTHNFDWESFWWKYDAVIGVMVAVAITAVLIFVLIYASILNNNQQIADCVKAFEYTEIQCRVIILNHLPVVPK